MTADAGRDWLLVALLGLSGVATLLVHAVFVPRHLPGEFVLALPYLVVGWASYALAFYALGRLLSSPPELPNMRAVDVGIAVFLGSVVLSGILDTAGFAVGRVPLAHVPAAVGVYVGLALTGWGLGERAKVIDRITEE